MMIKLSDKEATMIKMLNKIKENTFVINETKKYVKQIQIFFQRKNMKLNDHLDRLNNTVELGEERVSDP